MALALFVLKTPLDGQKRYCGNDARVGIFTQIVGADTGTAHASADITDRAVSSLIAIFQYFNICNIVALVK